ncbi:MAG: PD40 domain-containing protein [Thermoleophilaceae bacterium]|nr:PD40 domain-containing protein [Thermoleophilaceae bacterium]
MGERDGMLVLAVAGHSREWAAVADPHSGVTRKRRLPGGTLCHGPLLAVGGQVVFSGYRGRLGVARVLPLTLRGPARSLGEADTFAPSPAADHLWLGRWRGRRQGARLGLHQVDLEGRVSVSARILGARWGSLHAALRRGFVLTIRGSLVVWDNFLDAPSLTVRGGWFVAASETRVAWCGENCRRFRVWSRQGERTLSPPTGVRPLGSVGTFSPDGRQLATGATVRGRTRMAVVDLRSGVWTLVPGGRLGGYNAIAWSPSGNWLYFTDSDERVRAWRLGAPSTVAVPIRPGGTVISIATAP